MCLYCISILKEVKMFSDKQFTHVTITGWCSFLILLTSMLMLVSCVPLTMTATGTTPIPASEGYTEIIGIAKKLSTTSDTAAAELLIDKSRLFIKTHPKFEKTDEVYYILGTTLVQFDQPEEAISVLAELIRYYPISPAVEPGLLTLGLAYDKVNKHDKADETYNKLIHNSKYSDGKYAKTAQTLLQTDISDRKGALEGLSDNQGSPDFLGKTALDFQVVDLNGEPLSLAKFRGQVVLLDFWATWCGPCRAEMPNVKQTYEMYKNKKFQIVGISLDRAIVPLEEYIQKEGIAWPQYYDNGRNIANMYQVRAIPTTYLIDADGIIRYANLRGSALEVAVANLVEENMAR